jgi:hypothetical protein
MSGKYYPGGKASVSFGPGVAACPKEQATAFDMIDPACWKVFGAGIVIAGSGNSVQGGFEIFNFNVHNDGTSRAVPTVLDLEGTVA